MKNCKNWHFKGNINYYIGYWIVTKICTLVDLIRLNIFTPSIFTSSEFWYLLSFSSYLAKSAFRPLCFIFSNGGHFLTNHKSQHKLDTEHAKDYYCKVSSKSLQQFQRRRFFKKFTDDGRQTTDPSTRDMDLNLELNRSRSSIKCRSQWPNS